MTRKQTTTQKIAQQKRGLKFWLKRYANYLLIIFVITHLFILALILIWQHQPVHNSMFMVLHRFNQPTPIKQTWVEDQQISRYFKQAAIASEDANFTQHNGFEWQSIENALSANQNAGTIIHGGSTISQQLAKNLFLFPQRSYVRKAEETLITIMIEQLWSKPRILTVYLNIAEFGNGIYGVEAASQLYFGTSAKHISKEQAALLISMLPNPKYYQTHKNNQRLHNKQRIILQRMVSVALPK